MLKIGHVTFDCENPARVAEFWGAALAYTVTVHTEHIAEATHPDNLQPNLLFIKVPEPRSVKNRVHLDLDTDDRGAEVARLIGLGATRGETNSMGGYTWTTLQDPEGNELCVCRKDEH